MGKLTNNIQEMSEILINQFEKICSTPQSNMIITDKSTFFDDSDLKDIIITVSWRRNHINTCHSAAGIDGIPPILLKECAQELAHPLSYTFRKSLNESYIPTQFKEAIIIQIFKGVDNSCPRNYRPILLASVVMKVFERLYTFFGWSF